MDCEDEEIVLHQSPLDQYLEEVTDQAFGKYTRQPSHISNNKVSNIMETEGSDWLKNNLITCLKEYLPKKLIDTFDAIKSCHVLLNSAFLYDEDQKLLIDLYEEVQKVTKPKECVEESHSIFTNKGVTYSIIVLIFTIFFSMVVKMRCWDDALVYTFMLLLICGLVYYAKIRVVVKNVPKDILTNVQLFVDVFSAYNKVIDKVIRHIKEVEVIMHGYSQINIFHSLLHQKGLSNGEKCLKLRCCLMDGLIDLFNQLRINVRIILGNKRNNILFDYKEEYIAVMPLDAFSEVLYSSSNKNKNDVNVTPLDQLKAVVCLYRLQMSEYVYIMIVSLFTFHHDKIKKNIKDVLFSLEDLNKNILNISKSLEEQLNISVKLIFQKEKNLSEKKIQTVPTMENVLHSSEIHLHTALARIDEMKILFQQNSYLDEFPLDILQSLTCQFNLSLENAKFCIEDIVAKVQPNINRDVDVMPGKQIDVIDEKEENYVLFTNTSNDIGDMLYEGESDSVIRRESGMMNIDDIGDSLKDSRESRKLMRELKTILSVKESPVGLISFPLAKVDNNHHSDTEYSCSEEIKIEVIKEKRIYKSAYVYDPGDDDNGPNCLDTERLPRMQQMGLPMGFLSNLPMKNNMEEVTFGSSTDDEEVSGVIS